MWNKLVRLLVEVIQVILAQHTCTPASVPRDVLVSAESHFPWCF